MELRLGAKAWSSPDGDAQAHSLYGTAHKAVGTQKPLSQTHTHTHALSEPVNGCISNGSPTNPLNSSVCYRLGESCDEQSTSEVPRSWPPTKHKDTGSLCSSSWCCFRNSRLATRNKPALVARTQAGSWQWKPKASRRANGADSLQPSSRFARNAIKPNPKPNSNSNSNLNSHSNPNSSLIHSRPIGAHFQLANRTRGFVVLFTACSDAN